MSHMETNDELMPDTHFEYAIKTEYNSKLCTENQQEHTGSLHEEPIIKCTQDSDLYIDNCTVAQNDNVEDRTTRKLTHDIAPYNLLTKACKNDLDLEAKKHFRSYADVLKQKYDSKTAEKTDNKEYQTMTKSLKGEHHDQNLVKNLNNLSVSQSNPDQEPQKTSKKEPIPAEKNLHECQDDQKAQNRYYFNLRKIPNQIGAHENYQTPKYQNSSYRLDKRGALPPWKIYQDHGYLAIALMYHNDRKQHTILNTSSPVSTFPEDLLNKIDPYGNIPSYWDKIHWVERKDIWFDVPTPDTTRITFKFGFTIRQSKYPVLGTDFLKSQIFQSITKDALILKTKHGNHRVPIYLSTAFNKQEWKGNIVRNNLKNNPNINNVCKYCKKQFEKRS